MKNVCILLILLLAACGTKKQATEEEVATTDPKPALEQMEQLVDEQPEQAELTSERTDSVVFEYWDESISTKQTLTVNWLSKDSVKFELFSETDLCNYEEKGTAVRKQGTEIDEDETGMSYMTTEYEVVDAGKLWSLRIPEPERDNAKISYIYGEPRDECDPYEELMKKTPSNRVARRDE
jgi:hypothetical protein